jgi:large subunit ribosomal protein L10
MTRDQKTAAIAELKEMFEQTSFFYLADPTTLTVKQTNQLRRICFEKGITMKVAKNTLIRKALEALPEDRNYSGVFDALHGQTAVFVADVANVPARIIKEFRKGGKGKPEIKAAYIDSAIYLGDDQLEALTALKSKEELLGELIGLLQSPMSNLVGALKSSGGKIAGILKTLEERA